MKYKTKMCRSRDKLKIAILTYTVDFDLRWPILSQS